MTGNDRLSVPQVKKSAGLSAKETEVLTAIADVLIGGTETDPTPSSLESYEKSIDIAVAARTRDIAKVLNLIAEFEGLDAAGIDAQLRSWDKERAEEFQIISSIVAGSYFMLPEIKKLIGYPGQVRNIPKVDDAANDLADGILEPVIERGAIYVSANGE